MVARICLPEIIRTPEGAYQNQPKEVKMTNTTRRKFIATAAVGAAAAPLAAPALAQSTIKWRMQTYAGAALAAHVIDPAVNMFNKIEKMLTRLYM